MIEYQDGSTSEVGELEEMLGRFAEEVKEDDRSLEETPAGLHVGSEEELEAKREEKREERDLKERLSELEDEVEKMKAAAEHSSSPRGSWRVAVPSPEKVVQFSDQSIIS
jgi:TATA-binding protein-associated factor Taf7